VNLALAVLFVFWIGSGIGFVASIVVLDITQPGRRVRRPRRVFRRGL
jgi:hypothetical protein